jgi:hypothetical protein
LVSVLLLCAGVSRFQDFVCDCFLFSLPWARLPRFIKIPSPAAIVFEPDFLLHPLFSVFLFCFVLCGFLIHSSYSQVHGVLFSVQFRLGVFWERLFVSV